MDVISHIFGGGKDANLGAGTPRPCGCVFGLILVMLTLTVKAKDLTFKNKDNNLTYMLRANVNSQNHRKLLIIRLILTGIALIISISNHKRSNCQKTATKIHLVTQFVLNEDLTSRSRTNISE